MTQENLSSNDDRSKPRYQAPTISGTGNAGTTGAGNRPSASANSPGQKQAAPNSIRPTDWPAPDPTQPYQAPGPSFGAYPPPPVPGPYDWNKAASEAKSGNLYHYGTF